MSGGLSRSEVLKAGAGLAGAMLMPGVLAERPAKFRIVHLTDIHIQPELSAGQGVALCVKKILRLDPRPDFIITGGDHPMDLLAATRERADLQFRLLAEALKPLEMPVYHTIGNHDVFGWSMRSPITDTDPGYGKRLFEERVCAAPTYRSWNHKGWHFIVLDNIQPTNSKDWYSRVDDDQLQWLKADLEKTAVATPIIVTTHVPLFTIYNQYTNGTMFPTPAKLICQNGKEVHKLLKTRNVKLALQGHTHVIESCDYIGIRYQTAGSVCGEWWRGPRLGVHPEGFSVIDIDGKEAKWTYHPYGWHSPSVGHASQVP